MRTTVIALLSAAMLVACVTVTEVPLPDGTAGYVIDDCPDLATCYKKAAQVCGGKYELVNTANNTVGTEDVTATYHSMTIRCENHTDLDSAK